MEKADSLKAATQFLLSKNSPTIREVAEVIGRMVAIFPGSSLDRFFNRQLENEKIQALKDSKGNFDSLMVISNIAKMDLLWWINNIDSCFKTISNDKPDMELKSDASHLGWGPVHGDKSTGGRCTEKKSLQHINILELQAAFFALKIFCKGLSNTHVKLYIDNTTTVAYVNNMGGSHSLKCNALARDMWFWCVDRNIWLTAAHPPGSQNTQADRASRIFNDQTEWKLNPTVFQQIIDRLVMPEVDLSASRLNCQIDKYVAWQPDPGALAVYAFSTDWSCFKFYAFPPFSIIGRTVQKIEEDKAEGILLIPNWPTQPWFPKVMRLLVKEPILLPNNRQLLMLPYNKTAIHPAEQTKPASMSVIRESLQCKGIPQHTLSIIMASWRESTKKQYGTYLQRWQGFCSRRSVDPLSPSVNQVLEFLTELYDNNCGYSALNIARSALSALISLPGNISIGNHPLVSHYLRQKSSGDRKLSCS